MMDSSSSSSSSSGILSSSRMLLIMILGAFLLLLSSLDLLVQVVEAQGSWEVVVENAGIASMHTAVTHYGTVVLLDRTDIGASQLPLPNGECRNDPNDEVSLLVPHDRSISCDLV
jgi:hypothetical protein